MLPSGVLRPTEAGLDEGETSLHEDDQHRADDDPQQVHLLCGGGDGCGIDIALGECRRRRRRG